jgi:hypothetical protein
MGRRKQGPEDTCSAPRGSASVDVRNHPGPQMSAELLEPVHQGSLGVPNAVRLASSTGCHVQAASSEMLAQAGCHCQHLQQVILMTPV